MSKTKKALPVISELHFVSSLSLEAVLQMLSQQAQSDLTLTVTEMNSDHYRFLLERKGKYRQTTAQLEGQLRRWQGTMTRVDCDGTTSMDRIQWVGVIIIIIISTLFMGILILAGADPGEMIPFFLLFIAMIPIIFLGTAANSSEEYHPARMQQRREMESLLDMFIQLFQQHGTIELLNNEKEKTLNEHHSYAQRHYPQQSRRGTHAGAAHYAGHDLSDDAKSRQARKRRR